MDQSGSAASLPLIDPTTDSSAGGTTRPNQMVAMSPDPAASSFRTGGSARSPSDND
jgi:hypothetical protein